MKTVGEFELIARLTKGLNGQSDKIIRSVGDDTAAIRVDGQKHLLATCDAQIEGVHFIKEAISPKQIGLRAAAVNLSDIAAMGGTPTVALVSLAIPPDTQLLLLDGIYEGLREGLGQWGAQIVGGNTAALAERILIDLTLLGEVIPENMMERSGALPGDLVCITGSLGASAAGLKLLQNSEITLPSSLRDSAISRHLVPTPRMKEGAFLGASQAVTSCIDVSDGVYQDACHVAKASKVKIIIEYDKVPVAPEAVAISRHLDLNPVELALGGGEDFELLFTVSEQQADHVLEALNTHTQTPATVIGRVEKTVDDFSVKVNAPVKLTLSGFDHFLRS